MISPEHLVKSLDGHIMVIGGCGLLGHHVVKFLLENGKPASDISVFDITTKNNLYPDVLYIAGHLSSKSDVSAAFSRTKPLILINVASPDAMTPDKRVFARCNINGVQNIVDCAQEQGIRILVHSSSSEVIQDSYYDMIWATEEWPVLENPVNGSEYAKTKAIGEKIVLAANGKKGLLTTAIRLCTIFGEGDVVITRHFIELGRSGKIRFQVGQGKNLYDFIYAGNAAEGHLLAAKALLRAANQDGPIAEKERVDGEAFNLTNGDPWLFWGVARFVSTAAGYPIEEKDVWKIPMEIVCFFMAIWEFIYWVATLGGEPEIKARMLRYTEQVRTFDITKARERLGYKPRVSIEDGLRRGVAWHVEKSKNSGKTE
ncbi:putative sterol-4-alpha-carboxylate 3-dehydrogenase, decarboxylating [Pleomassaria siparia CBS 279.74]|uniref:Putative sterol-4-alpha-carboxylate 3-dehydrogenase, decarboxylating n=1 Tax=Pleomassaria siparia CBS 279.74 TaxID=1314801 RepID=A0A6G1JRX3_9PLEO|nr:putative sterol-4-alpha-carboxylate 3-dehydrogenase, decarboxylating [Pleomassaria siparia CBS 279.74]